MGGECSSWWYRVVVGVGKLCWMLVISVRYR